MGRFAVLLLLLVLLSTSTLVVVSQSVSQRNKVTRASKKNLYACLDKAGIQTVTGADPEYNKARRTLSKFSNNYPVAVVYPASVEQVQAAVKCAQAFKVKVLPRCGNHANEGETVETGAITLDMQKMHRVRVAQDHNSAWAEGGAIMGQLLAEVVKVTNGTRGFPGGVRPSVGVAGFILGGGFGGYTRYAGLGADNLIAIKGVDANGNIITADKDNNPELLWASRGAGGGKFVVVTDFHLRLMDVTPGVTNFMYVVPYDQAVDAMMFYQTWAPNLPDIITHRAGVDDDPDSGKTSYYIGGRYMGSVADTKKALKASGLHNSEMLRVDKFTFKHTNYLEAVEDAVGFPLPPGPDKLSVIGGRKYWEFEYAWSYKYRSLITNNRIPRDFFETALEFSQFDGAEVEFQALTGYVSRVPTDATSVGHLRNGHFVVILRGAKESSGNKVTSAYGEKLPDFVLKCPALDNQVAIGNMNATDYMQKLGAMVPEVRSYINFRDTDLPLWASDYLTAYHGDQLPALECVKLKYDPSNLFAMPMDVTPPAGSATHCPELLKRVGAAAANYSRHLLTSGPARSAPPSFITAGRKPSAPSSKVVTEAAKTAPAMSASGRRLARHLGWLHFSKK